MRLTVLAWRRRFFLFLFIDDWDWDSGVLSLLASGAIYASLPRGEGEYIARHYLSFVAPPRYFGRLKAFDSKYLNIFLMALPTGRCTAIAIVSVQEVWLPCSSPFHVVNASLLGEARYFLRVHTVERVRQKRCVIEEVNMSPLARPKHAIRNEYGAARKFPCAVGALQELGPHMVFVRIVTSALLDGFGAVRPYALEM